MKTLFIKLLDVYHYWIGPFLRTIIKTAFGTTSTCTHNPTCSVYTKQMIKAHGTIRGLILGCRRILSCQMVLGR